jgi:peptide/nickel transport system permease protein
MIVILGFLLAAFLAPWLAPFDPDSIDLMHTMEGPSRLHPLGVDQFGRDILSRILFGTRTSLLLGVVVVGAAGLIGVFLGLIAGFFGGIIDRGIGFVVDILMTLPSIVVALAIITVLGPGLSSTMIAIGISMVPRFVRIVRGSVLSVRDHEFVQSARALGSRNQRLLRMHVLPNSLAPVIVQGSLLTAQSVLVAAGLGFLGLGAQPPTAEWGQMLAEGRSYLRAAPHITLFPGLAIMLMVFGFNLLGDGLRDALDVRSR